MEWNEVDDDPDGLRCNAEHCRRLAKLIIDQQTVAELLEVAARLEAKAEKLEAEQREEKGGSCDQGKT